MQAVILAGGKGSRLHPLTTDIPKSMAPMFNRPVMEHLVELLVRHDIRDIIVTVSHLAKNIVDHFGDGTKWGVRIRYSVEDTPKGTAGGVKELQPVLSETFVVLSGDAVTDFDLTEAIDYHRRKSALATLMLYEVEDPTEYGVVAAEDDGRVTRFFEKPKADEAFGHIVNTGIYVLEPEVLSSVPYDTPYDFGRELFPRLLRNMEPVYGCRAPGYWCDIGNLLQYRSAHFDTLMGRVNLKISGKQVDEGVWIGDGCDVHSTARLSAPVFVGQGAEIRRNVAVGSLAVLGDKALLDEGSIVQRSIVGNGALIGRSSKITDCVIGSGYHVEDNGDVRNRVIANAGERLVSADWEAEDVPTIRINRVGEPSATPLAA